MKKAIITKYIPPSNVRGSRYRATAEGAGNSLTAEAGQAKAAFLLAIKRGWHGFYVGGGTPSGFCFVNMAGDDHHGTWHHARALAEHARVGHDKPYGFECEDWFYIASPSSGGTSTEFGGHD